MPSALALHAAGRTVVGIDVSEARLADVRAGRVDLPAAPRAELAAALDTGDCG
ncbi:hypothetical protein NKH77_31445 [Streptomyces sp. M19]